MADTALVEDVEVATGHWIGGEWVSSSGAFEDVSPIDEHVIAEVARGGAGEVDAAVGAARRAFEEWGRTDPKERARVLHAIADGIEARVPELATSLFPSLLTSFAPWP